MKLSELKKELQHMSQVEFQLENGQKVPSHYHVTEVGSVQKNFIDCGGKIRNEKKIQIQLWNSFDVDHRLNAEKFLKILKLSEDKLELEDSEIEVEYQGETIGKYQLELKNDHFILKSMKTDCLAKSNCGVDEKLTSLKNHIIPQSSCCGSGAVCC